MGGGGGGGRFAFRVHVLNGLVIRALGFKFGLWLRCFGVEKSGRK